MSHHYDALQIVRCRGLEMTVYTADPRAAVRQAVTHWRRAGARDKWGNAPGPGERVQCDDGEEVRRYVIGADWRILTRGSYHYSR